MKTEIIKVSFSGKDFINNEIGDAIGLGNELVIVIIEPCNNDSNVIFTNAVCDGWYSSNLLTELNDKYLAPAILELDDFGYKLELKETVKDIFNKAVKID